LRYRENCVEHGKRDVAIYGSAQEDGRHEEMEGINVDYGNELPRRD